MLDADNLPTARGQLIAIEGIDQAGKQTQARLLARKLVRKGYKVSVWSFPDYSTPLGRQLRAYLHGRGQLEYHAVHLLYAANKWERAERLVSAIRSGQNIIVNRYSPSNLAYGQAHGLPLVWLSSLEKDLPKPDLVFILDIVPATSFKRKRRRRDIHEGDRKYLGRVRSAYLRLARRYGWKVISAEGAPETVHLELWTNLSHFLAKKRLRP